ncbi:hypothetical protein HPB50_013157 [Hyalomma asiaticum]|uniref:Uncharacterized protein n=1 Tax=Hyalomma asiaticum TaxID=266040 RepID=A0ACB7SY21_HYAAI|nr:hypothetical protein HPB50_013157 [Hyalomma asiaticum]
MRYGRWVSVSILRSPSIRHRCKAEVSADVTQLQASGTAFRTADPFPIRTAQPVGPEGSMAVPLSPAASPFANSRGIGRLPVYRTFPSNEVSNELQLDMCTLERREPYVPGSSSHGSVAAAVRDYGTAPPAEFAKCSCSVDSRRGPRGAAAARVRHDRAALPESTAAEASGPETGTRRAPGLPVPSLTLAGAAEEAADGDATSLKTYMEDVGRRCHFVYPAVLELELELRSYQPKYQPPQSALRSCVQHRSKVGRSWMQYPKLGRPRKAETLDEF